MTVSDLDVSLRSVSSEPIIRARLIHGTWLVNVIDEDAPHLHGRGQGESLALAMGMALEGFRARVAVRMGQEWDEQEARVG